MKLTAGSMLVSFTFDFLFASKMPFWVQLTRNCPMLDDLQVKKKRPGRDGKVAGLVPVLYVSQP